MVSFKGSQLHLALGLLDLEGITGFQIARGKTGKNDEEIVDAYADFLESTAKGLREELAEDKALIVKRQKEHEQNTLAEKKRRLKLLEMTRENTMEKLDAEIEGIVDSIKK